MDTQLRTATVEQRLQWIASTQHGVITREEARRAGVTDTEFRRRVRIGYLIRIFRGVYRLGHEAPSRLATYMAATKACGAGAGLSGLAGSHLLRLLRDPPDAIEVTCPRERRIPGLVVHRARQTRPRLMEVRGIPVVTPAWALIDIAGRLDDEALGWACHEAVTRYRNLVRPEVVGALIAERGAVKGSGRLMRMLAGDDPLLLSRLEKAFIRLLRLDGLLLPETNRRQAEGCIDCRWPGLALIVELDSFRFHNSRRAWERDRERDRAARQRGEQLIRYTWRDVVEEPDAVRAEMRALLPLS